MELVTLGIGLQRVQIKLLGVKAIIAKSFDRVHRSNLASSGIVPLCFKSGEEAETLGLTRHERYTIHLPSNINEIKPVASHDYGGMLPYIIRSLSNEIGKVSAVKGRNCPLRRMSDLHYKKTAAYRGKKSSDHQFVGKVLGIYRGRTSSEYFDGLSDGPILGSSDEMFLGIFIGNFRGTEPSENSEEGVPRYIPTTYSEEMFVGNF
ncbi:hypothetical protein F2Q70_00005038 [Brassica cretica]|uniref:Aconitase A/isopropylmalate dehydratase small subunit swivel domain-containing protein n=1 Tax=Brassica cretica TaxID=69181 RepID=A0A8S9J1J2_BRACR|nr:hypothetical protein F2Q70_00005038 [Brassica cretica]